MQEGFTNILRVVPLYDFCEKESGMFAKTIKISTIFFVVLTIIFTLIYQCSPNAVILSIAITFGTISYHFLMRLFVGYVVNGIFLIDSIIIENGFKRRNLKSVYMKCCE